MGGGGGGGGQGVRTPMKNNKNIGFLSKSGRDPLEITKLSNQHSMLGHYQHTRETPKWRIAGRRMMAHL